MCANRRAAAAATVLAAVLALLSAALVLGGNALLDAGWGPALRSVADRVYSVTSKSTKTAA